MTLRPFLITLAGATAVSGSALAADAIVAPAAAPVEMAAPTQFFQGFYLGAGATGAVGDKPETLMRGPLKVLTIPGLTDGTGSGFEGTNFPACIEDGDFDGCDDIDSLDDLSGLITGGAGDPQQFTAQQLLAQGEGVPTLTDAQLATLQAEVDALQAGEPIPDGTFGFTAPSDAIDGALRAEAVDEEELFGFGGAVTLGYTGRIGDFTLGGELVGGYADMRGEFDYSPIGDSESVIGDGSGVQELEYYGLARLQLGYVFDRFNPYVTGGAALGNVEVNAFSPDSFARAETDETQYGYTLGAGANYAVSENISLNVDYSYIDLGENDYDLEENFVIEDLETEAHVVRAGVNFSF